MNYVDVQCGVLAVHIAYTSPVTKRTFRAQVYLYRVILGMRFQVILIKHEQETTSQTDRHERGIHGRSLLVVSSNVSREESPQIF